MGGCVFVVLKYEPDRGLFFLRLRGYIDDSSFCPSRVIVFSIFGDVLISLLLSRGCDHIAAIRELLLCTQTFKSKEPVLNAR